MNTDYAKPVDLVAFSSLYTPTLKPGPEYYPLPHVVPPTPFLLLWAALEQTWRFE